MLLLLMKILIACEFSGVVRDAFISKGHDAVSCDILPTEKPGPHFIGDVRDYLNFHWDLLIAHPPCTYLASSGARWWRSRYREQQDALQFVYELWRVNIEKIAIENPIGCISTHIKKPTQIIQPWQFGHGETKATCLWLKGLKPLTPTNIVDGRQARIHRMSPGPNRWRERSRTYQGIADAMAEQWSKP